MGVNGDLVAFNLFWWDLTNKNDDVMATASGITVGTYHDVPLVKYYPKWISQGTVKAVNTADLLWLKTRIGRYQQESWAMSRHWLLCPKYE